MGTKTIQTKCCIAGGGPAGIMLGYLLARSGIDVLVIEKHPDFFRDFRGDTIHPSTMTILDELDLLDEFLALPHQKTYQLKLNFENEKVILSDFRKTFLKTPYIAFIPQWDFLNFIVSHAKKLPSFQILMDTKVEDIILKDRKVVGLTAKNNDTLLKIHADLVVGADGRNSTVRAKAGLHVQPYGAPMDVLWFRISRGEQDPTTSQAFIKAGNMLILIDRGDYWQCGYVILKNSFAELKSNGLEAFQENIKALAPFLDARDNFLKSWDEVQFLKVTVDRLKAWQRDGLICIGDAAHAMSPIGGVGINLAIQDAVAAANILAPAFANGKPSLEILQQIQKRREFVVKLTQKMQIVLQKRLIERVLLSTKDIKTPFIIKCLKWFPFLNVLPAYMIGVGFRPEHVQSSLEKTSS